MVRYLRRIMIISSFLIAVFIFLAGLYVGTFFDSSRIIDVNEILIKAQMDIDSLVTENDFFNTFVVTDCDLLNNRMNYLSGSLGEIGRTLSRYDAKNMMSEQEYDILKEKYFLLELKVYNLKKRTSDLCTADIQPTILFFYNTKNNQESLNQGYALDSIVKNNKKLSIFSFDADFNNTAIKSLIFYYNITSTPTIVINFNDKHAGYVSEGEINALILNNKGVVVNKK